ncbi:odorant receptor 22b-like, partial [Aphis craccivora]
QLQFYQIFHSSGIKIFGRNLHQLFYIIYALVALCIKCYGISTLFSTNCKFLSYTDYVLVSYGTSHMCLSLWKLFKCLKDRNRLLDLFKIGQLNFLTSEKCAKYSKILTKHRDKNLKFANNFLIFSFMVIIQWFIFPIVLLQIINFENSNVRAQNIINLCFGVSTKTYNKYYLIFYLLELVPASITVYMLLMMDTLIISLCSAIIYQQDIRRQFYNNLFIVENIIITLVLAIRRIIQNECIFFSGK